MDYRKCLEILGLKDGYTEEELKKRYRELMKQYHPDNYMKDTKENRVRAEEKAKEINEAYDTLLKFLGKSSSFNLTQYKNDIINELKELLKYDESLDNEFPDLQETLSDVKFCLGFISVAGSKVEVDKRVIFLKNAIKNAYNMIVKSYYDENFIDENEVKDKIDYNLTINELCKKLIQIKEKYSKRQLFINRVKEEVRDYELYAYYDELKDKIDRVVTNILKCALNMKYKKTDDLIVRLHTEIMELFNTYNPANTEKKEEKEQKPRLKILLNNKNCLDPQICVLSEENDSLYINYLYYGNPERKRVERSFIEYNYIGLDEFLKNAIFVGKYFYISFNEYGIMLYYDEKSSYGLFILNGEIIFEKYNYDADFYRNSLIYNKFKDKNYLEKVLIDSVFGKELDIYNSKKLKK